METIMVNINDLTPHPRNQEFFSDITGEKWEDLLNSIRENGIKVPILITQDNVIVSGHQRVRAARELGMTEAPANREHYSSKDEILRDLIELNTCQRGEIDGTKSQKLLRINELERIYGVYHGNHKKDITVKTRKLTPEEIELIAREKAWQMPWDTDKDLAEHIEKNENKLKQLNLDVPEDTSVDSEFIDKLPYSYRNEIEKWGLEVSEYIEELIEMSNDAMIASGKNLELSNDTSKIPVTPSDISENLELSNDLSKILELSDNSQKLELSNDTSKSDAINPLIGTKTQKDIIATLKMSQKTYHRIKSLNNLIPEFMDLLDNDLITMTDAEKILKGLDTEHQKLLYYKELPGRGYVTKNLAAAIESCKAAEIPADLGGVTMKDYIKGKMDYLANKHERDIEVAVQDALAAKEEADRNSAGKTGGGFFEDDHSIILAAKIQLHNVFINYISKLQSIGAASTEKLGKIDREHFAAMLGEVHEIERILGAKLNDDIIDV